jgi:hypothetical protein
LEINVEMEGDKWALKFTASLASPYRLSTNKVTHSDINKNIPDLDRLLKENRRLGKLWHETRDPVCKTAVNWVVKSIR